MSREKNSFKLLVFCRSYHLKLLLDHLGSDFLFSRFTYRAHIPNSPVNTRHNIVWGAAFSAFVVVKQALALVDETFNISPQAIFHFWCLAGSTVCYVDWRIFRCAYEAEMFELWWSNLYSRNQIAREKRKQTILRNGSQLDATTFKL